MPASSSYQKIIKVVLFYGDLSGVHEVNQVLQLVKVDLAEDDGGVIWRILRQNVFQISEMNNTSSCKINAKNVYT